MSTATILRLIREYRPDDASRLGDAIDPEAICWELWGMPAWQVLRSAPARLRWDHREDSHRMALAWRSARGLGPALAGGWGATS